MKQKYIKIDDNFLVLEESTHTLRIFNNPGDLKNYTANNYQLQSIEKNIKAISDEIDMKTNSKIDSLQKQKQEQENELSKFEIIMKNKISESIIFPTIVLLMGATVLTLHYGFNVPLYNHGVEWGYILTTFGTGAVITKKLLVTNSLKKRKKTLTSNLKLIETKIEEEKQKLKKEKEKKKDDLSVLKQLRLVYAENQEKTLSRNECFNSSELELDELLLDEELNNRISKLTEIFSKSEIEKNESGSSVVKTLK